jgi:hypothetical protein
MRGHRNEPLPRQTRFQAVLVQPALNVEQPVAGNDGDHATFDACRIPTAMCWTRELTSNYGFGGSSRSLKLTWHF